jgi:hypothetical protein
VRIAVLEMRGLMSWKYDDYCPVDERTPVLEMREEDFCPGDERILAWI